MAVNNQVITEEYALYNGDCCEVMRTLPDSSIHLSVYSPPFACESGGALYNYSSSPRDFSNSKTYAEFFEQYEFLLEELTRITMPGRISAVHCMDVPMDGANICGYSDFPGDIIRLYRKHGWDMLPRICIWKEPLEVRNRTMSKALAHRTICEDSTLTNVASADYLIPFRKRGKNPVPVSHPTGLHRYAGSREMPQELLEYRYFNGKQTANRYSHWIWRNYASCFWDDIRLHRVLPYVESKEKTDERHQHPLQLDVIERCCVLWTNPNENVFTPFMGVGSEVAGAVALGRRGVGVELKESYFVQAVKNVANAVELVDPPEDQGPNLFTVVTEESE
jgi:DNA modification methylase